ncbi:MAG: hypothetical protein AAF211_30115, partial [Myxococcota bacterium]
GINELGIADRHGGGIFGTGPLFSLVMLPGSVLRNHTALADGGALYMAKGTATLGTIRTSYANHGGGIYVSEGDASLEGVIEECGAISGSGGAAYVTGLGNLDVQADLSGNWATEHGGAIFAGDRAEVGLVSTTIHDNVARANGGGLYVADDARVVDAVFTALPGTRTIEIRDNRAGFDHAFSGPPVQVNTTSQGGGMFVATGRIELVGTQASPVTLSRNVATLEGGGISTNQATLDIQHLRLDDNEARTGSGGGLSLRNLSDAELTGILEIVGNTAGEDGGGVSVRRSELSAEGPSYRIAGNVAGRDGGGLFLGASPRQGQVNIGMQFVAPSAPTLLVTANYAGGEGGGAAVGLGSTFDVAKVAMESNTAQTRGGGLAIDSAGMAPPVATTLARFAEATFIKNRAVGPGSTGGAISATNGADVMVFAGVWEANEANQGSAAFIDDSNAVFGGPTCGTPTAEPCVVFLNNQGLGSGSRAALSVASSGAGPGSTTLVSRALFSGNLADDSPGVHVEATNATVTFENVSIVNSQSPTSASAAGLTVVKGGFACTHCTVGRNPTGAFLGVPTTFTNSIVADNTTNLTGVPPTFTCSTTSATVTLDAFGRPFGNLTDVELQ